MVTSFSLVPLQLHSVTSKANLCFSQSNIDTTFYHSVCKMRLLVFLCLHPSLSQPLSSSFPSVLICFSPAWLFVTLWTVAHQTLLSIGFFRQEYWSGLPFPSPGDLSHPLIEPKSPVSLANGRQILFHWATREAPLNPCWEEDRKKKWVHVYLGKKFLWKRVLSPSSRLGN